MQILMSLMWEMCPILIEVISGECLWHAYDVHVAPGALPLSVSAILTGVAKPLAAHANCVLLSHACKMSPVMSTAALLNVNPSVRSIPWVQQVSTNVSNSIVADAGEHNCLNTMLHLTNTTCYVWFQTYPFSFSYEAKERGTGCTYNIVIGVAVAAVVLLLLVAFVTYVVTKHCTKKKFQKPSQSPDASPDPCEVQLWMYQWIWWLVSPNLNPCR